MPSDPSGRLSLATKRNLTIVVTIATILLLLLAAEATVRLRALIKYGSTAAYEDYYTVDPTLGLRVAKANFTSGRISTNSLGFRGPEIPSIKPPGVLRVAFLGASTTWCAEVSGNEYTWPALVVRSLRDALPASKIDYVNAGLPGYTMESILKNYQYRVAPLSPDMVIIYEATNNFSGEMRDLAAAQGITRSAAVQQIGWLGHFSLLWYLIEKNLMVLTAERQVATNDRHMEVDVSKLGEGYRNVLRELVRAAQRDAKLVAIATFSIQLRRGQDPAQQRRAAESAVFFMPFVTPDLVIDGIDRYNQVAREVAAETGALLIEGANDIPGDPAHFHDTVHFTDAGSKAMAERISKAMLTSARFTSLVKTAASAGHRP